MKIVLIEKKKMCLFHEKSVEMGAGFGGLGAMGASMANPNMVQTYQAMMQNIQNLIAYNPDFLTKGIPNNLLQMCMEQTKMPTMYGVSIESILLTNFDTFGVFFFASNGIQVYFYWIQFPFEWI